MLPKTKTLIAAIIGILVVIGGGLVWIFTHEQGGLPHTGTSQGNIPSTHQSNTTSVPAKVVIQATPSAPNATQVAQVDQLVSTLLASNNKQSFDASGFIQYVYQHVGVSLPRTIAQQSQVGTKVQSMQQLANGDLVFFHLTTPSRTNVTFDGIYLGHGQFAAVTTQGLKQIPLSDTYWSSHFSYGSRVLP